MTASELFDEIVKEWGGLTVNKVTSANVKVVEDGEDRQAWLSVPNKSTGVTQRYHLWKSDGDPFYELSLTMDVVTSADSDERDDRFPSVMVMNPVSTLDVREHMTAWAASIIRRMDDLYHRKR